MGRWVSNNMIFLCVSCIEIVMHNIYIYGYLRNLISVNYLILKLVLLLLPSLDLHHLPL